MSEINDIHNYFTQYKITPTSIVLGAFRSLGKVELSPFEWGEPFPVHYDTIESNVLSQLHILNKMWLESPSIIRSEEGSNIAYDRYDANVTTMALIRETGSIERPGAYPNPPLIPCQPEPFETPLCANLSAAVVKAAPDYIAHANLESTEWESLPNYYRLCRNTYSVIILLPPVLP